MDMESARRALKETAQRQGITEEQVVLEIEKAIENAIAQAEREQDHSALERWQEIPCRGKIPNAYELVAYLGGKIQNLTYG